MPAVDAQRFDIAIVGGSHAGLAMALALGRTLGTGLRLALIERHPFNDASAVPDPRAFAISAGSRNLLEAIGVWDKLALNAQPVTAIDITDSSLDHAIRPVLLSYDSKLEGGAPGTYIVSRQRELSARADWELGHVAD